MKVEIGESLMLSWLRHAKNCQVVQLNWKPSTSSWDLYNEIDIEQLMNKSSDYFVKKFGLDIYKQNTSHLQLLQQGEIDALGIMFKGKRIEDIYAIDIAFHENGLNYGSKEETISRIIKKMIRTAMIIYGYFDLREGNIIFASPKVHNSVLELLKSIIEDINKFMYINGFNFKFLLYVNSDFREKIFEPVISMASSVADTSELFMRSIQMYNLFATENKPDRIQVNREAEKKIEYNEVEIESINGLDELKIGALVRTSMRKLATENKIPRDIIDKLTTYEYSKNIFNINYPLLKKIDKNKPIADQRQVSGRPRYWNEVFRFSGEEYFVCQEWYELSRKYYIGWLERILKNNSNLK